MRRMQLCEDTGKSGWSKQKIETTKGAGLMCSRYSTKAIVAKIVSEGTKGKR